MLDNLFIYILFFAGLFLAVFLIQLYLESKKPQNTLLKQPISYFANPLVWLNSLLYASIASFIIIILIGAEFSTYLYLGFLILFLAFLTLLPKVIIDSKVKKFETRFPDAVDVIILNLKSGRSMDQAFLNVADTFADPVRNVFTEICDRTKLGVPLETNLKQAKQNMPSPAFAYFCTLLMLLVRTGGNAVNIFQDYAFSLRAQATSKSKIKSILAQSKTTMLLMSIFPVLVFIYSKYFFIGYLDILFDTFVGNIILIIAAVLYLLGFIVTYRLTKIEI